MAFGRESIEAGLLRQGRPSAVSEIPEYRVVLVDHCAAGHIGRLHVASRDKDVFPAIIIEIGNVRTVSCHWIAQGGHSPARRHLDKPTLAIVLIDGESFILQGNEDHIGRSIIVQIPKIDSHTRNEVPVLWKSHAALERNFLEFVIPLIMKEKVKQLVVGNKNVGETIAIIIGYTHSHALSQLGADSRGRGDVLEFSVAFVQEQLIRKFLVKFRMTVLRLIFEPAVRLLRPIPLQVVDYKEIEQPVVIDIQPGSSHRPQGSILRVRFGESRLLANIREGTIAVIVIQGVAVNACYEDVFETVIVVVSNRNANVEPSSLQPCLLGNVVKCAVAIVMKEPIPVFRRVLFQSGNIGTVRKKDVRKSVI